MNAVEVLKEARARLAKPGAWTKGAPARDIYGKLATSLDAEVQWCAVGALPLFGIIRWCTLDYLEKALAEISLYKRVERYNDAPGRTVEDILSLYDRAIEMAENELR